MEAILGLNPFFIRSIVRSLPYLLYLAPHEVLIPSSSGPSFDPFRIIVIRTINVLIPSSSGQSFDPAAAAAATAAAYVLIPSSSGQSFDLTSPPTPTPPPSLNPFFIRSIVRSDCLPLQRTPKNGLNPFFIRSIVRSSCPRWPRLRRAS